jgi:hypothetical protein
VLPRCSREQPSASATERVGRGPRREAQAPPPSVRARRIRLSLRISAIRRSSVARCVPGSEFSAALLNARGLKRVFGCGLATDLCVAHSAPDAHQEGFETFVIEDACRALDADNSLAKAWARRNAAEVWRVQSAEILG